MKPMPIKTRIAGIVFALLMSAVVLGATVAGMVSGSSAPSQVVTLEPMVVMAPSATRVN